MKKLKGVFKPLKLYFKWGKYWDPILWCPKPSYIHIVSRDVGWKDKYNTPRYEGPPYVWIYLFGLNIIWYWDLPLHNWTKTDDYWEQALWYLFYNKGDIESAKNGWPWEDYKTKESTWSDEFLI